MLRKIISWLIVLFLGTSLFSVIVYRFMPVYVTPLMVKRAIQTGSFRWHHEWVPLEDMSRWLPRAVVLVEDGRFYQHHGVDWKAIEEARKYNEKHGTARGGSGITQQTVKNVFLWEGDSFLTRALRKPFEIYFAYLVDFIWGKQRVMEVYLNSIEMGPAVYGAQAAAEYYWNKPASQLSKRQCVLIACSLKNPIRFSPVNPGRNMQRQVNKIMRWM